MSKRVSFYKTAEEQIQQAFKDTLKEYRSAGGIATEDRTELKSLFEASTSKFKKLHKQVMSLMELFHFEFEDSKRDVVSVDISTELTGLIRKIQSENDDFVDISLNLDKKIPLISVHRQLFQAWMSWCVLRLSNENELESLDIETSFSGEVVRLHIKPTGKIQNPSLLWSGFEWSCAERYFFLESTDVQREGDGSLLFSFITSDTASTKESVDSSINQAREVISKIREGIDLPTLSPVATKIIKMALDDTTSAQQIADVMKLDPALTSKVLRVVNSALFGFAKEITTLSQAVAIIGMKALQTIALSVSMLSSFPLKSTDKFDYTGFWERSIVAAIAAKLIGQIRKSEYDEEIFICGLTQNIGSLIFAAYFPKQYGKLAQEHYLTGSDLSALEMKNWGLNHAQVGYEVFSHWKMPRVFCDVILYHHDPESLPAGDKKLKHLINIIYVSDLVSKVFYQKEELFSLTNLKKEFADRLNMKDTEVDDLMEKISSEAVTVAGDLDLKLSEPKEYSSILSTANLKLQSLNLDYEGMNRELTKAKEEAESLAAQLTVANRKLEEKAAKDGLTNLYNHRFFYEILRKEFSNAQRHKHSLSCIMFDIDFFKKFNDNYGHREGDKLLRVIATIFKKALREGDYAARYGGEEFALILPNTSIEYAYKVADRIRQVVEQTEFSKKISAGSVTISGGVACLENKNFTNGNVFVEAADQALYKSKDNGRNQVTKFTF